MQVETAIENWRNWQTKPSCKPEVLAPIDGGLSNQSYLLEAAGSRLVLRINSVDHSLPGINRKREARIWRAAAHAGIAPQLWHAGGAFMVSEFIAGGNMAQNLQTEATVQQAISLIGQCHCLEVDVECLDYASHIQRYWDLIESEGIKVDESLILKRQPMLDILTDLLAAQNDFVLCHHDPVKSNFVGSARQLYLIDWEYAAKGMAVMDYAALAIEWGLADQSIIRGGTVTAELLSKAKKFYQYLCLLWASTQNSI